MPKIVTSTDSSGRKHFWTHFSSWLEFVETANRPSAWSGWDVSKTALDFALYGWPEGRERMRRFTDKLDLAEIYQQCTKFAKSYDVGGMMPDVPLYSAGEPAHMIDLGSQQVASHPIIRIQVNIDSPGFISNETMMNQAIAVCSLCDMLEVQGYQCEIRLANATFASGGSKPSLTMYTVPFKSAGEPLDRDLAVFALGHSSVLREFLFHLYTTDLDVGRRFGHTMGSPTDAIPDDYTEPGTINIPPADRKSTSVEVSLKRLIEVVKGAKPEVDWTWLDLLLAQIEALLREMGGHKPN
jgi:hypothetical protein